MTIKYADIPDEILDHARENYCGDGCEGCLRQTPPYDCEEYCTGFRDECVRLVEEEKEQMHADMAETHRRLTRDMVNDWRRARP